MGEKKRSKEDEEALDRKIAEIRKKNLLIAQRKEVVDEDRANFANAIGETIRRSESPTKEPKQSNGTVKTAKSPKKNVWDREWDAGKTSADTWKENVPEMGRTTRGGHSSWGQRGRFRGGRGRGSNRNDFSMHDDRTAEPKKQPERHVSAENPSDGANIKVSVQNEKELIEKILSPLLREIGSLKSSLFMASKKIDHMEALMTQRGSGLNPNEVVGPSDIRVRETYSSVVANVQRWTKPLTQQHPPSGKHQTYRTQCPRRAIARIQRKLGTTGFDILKEKAKNVVVKYLPETMEHENLKFISSAAAAKDMGTELIVGVKRHGKRLRVTGR